MLQNRYKIEFDKGIKPDLLGINFDKLGIKPDLLAVNLVY